MAATAAAAAVIQKNRQNSVTLFWPTLLILAQSPFYLYSAFLTI